MVSEYGSPVDRMSLVAASAEGSTGTSAQHTTD